MRIVLGLLALSAAAACGDDGMLPVGGGLDGGGNFPDGSLIDAGGGGIDSSVDGSMVITSDGSVTIVGRVCLALDPRKLNTCETTGASGFTVKLGDATATTAADGTFTITGGTGTEWTVSGATIMTSHMLIGDYEIPALLKTTYQTMLTTNLQTLTLNPGEGAVMVQVISNGFGVAGAFADTNPSASWEPFYDGPDSQPNTTWDQDATEANGAIWVPGFDVGTASVTVTFIDDASLDGLPIYDGHITFATAIFPVP